MRTRKPSRRPMRLRRALIAVTAVFFVATCLTLDAARWRSNAVVEVVVSYFREPPHLLERTLRETRRLSPARVTVYTKGGADLRLPGVDVVRQLVNEGREVDAYLAWILDNYYTLPDYVLFTQAVPNDWRGFQRKLRAFRGSDVHDLGWVATYDPCPCTGCFFANQSRMARIAPLYEMAVGRACPGDFVAFINGQMVVSKRAIYQQSRRFYQYLYELVHAPPDHWIHDDEALIPPAVWNFSRNDPLIIHVIERSWPFIFGCLRPERMRVWQSTDAWYCHHVGPPSTVFQPREVPRKTVWLLWLSGWDQAPWVARRVAAGWAARNPGWNVELLSEATVRLYLPHLPDITATPQARSDQIRLHLLAEYGGVWADATLACMQPLDDWVEEALAPSGVWAYHGTGWPPPRRILRENTLYPASWFLVARPGNALVTAWRDAADTFWSLPADAINYFWMDALLRQLLKENDTIAEVWRQAGYLSCEDEYSSHWLQKEGRLLAPLRAEDKARLRADPPRVMKLSHKGGVPRRGPFSRRFQRSGMWHVLEEF